MNWMIDGAHGDLYRQAMGFPALHAAQDAWEAERRAGTRIHRGRHPLKARLRLLRRMLTRLANTRDSGRMSAASEGFVS